MLVLSPKPLEKLTGTGRQTNRRTGAHVVGMNKSLNEMMEEFVSSQAQVKLIKSEQDKFFNELKEDKNSLEHVFNDSKV